MAEEATPTTVAPTEQVLLAETTPEVTTDLLLGSAEGTDATPPDSTETPAAEPKAEEKVIPEAYDIKAPEGVTLDEKALAEFTTMAKEFGLSNEQAQKLADFDAARMKAHALDATAAYEKQQSDWRDEFAADKDFGGEKMTASVLAANKALIAMTTPEERVYIKDSGLSNYPPLVKMLARAHSLFMSEGTWVSGGKQANEVPPEVKMFPNSK
jgi:hypothetical protein